MKRRLTLLPRSVPAAAISLVLVLLAVLLPAAPVAAAAAYTIEARYDVDLKLDWATRKVHVKTTIDVLNDGDDPIRRLHLNTAAAKLGGLNNLKVKVDGASAGASRSGQTLTVPLGRTLKVGERTTVWIAYRARLRTTASGRSYYFAKLDGVAQLYRFIPWLSRKIPFGSSNHGEPFVTAVSPRVDVKVSADRPLVWATTGRKVKKLNARTFTFVAKNVRDFNVAASPAYQTARGRSKDGQTVILAHSRSGNARRLVVLARTELARFESVSGVPYPHATYRIAETGGGLAMESPALIWIPRSRPAADLPYLVSHETAHQWWYSTVGNDQSTNAFADEAMADYFSRKAHLSIRSSRCRTDRLDREIRAYSERCYFEVIYIQGSRFLDKLRKDFGNARFKAAVKAYSRDNRFGIASNVRLLEAFRAKMGSGVLPRYSKRFPGHY